MLRLNRQRRQELSETLRDLANLVFAAFVVGQLVGDGSLSWPVMLLGSVSWCALVGFASTLSGRGVWSKRS
jgi:hypothetical protein